MQRSWYSLLAVLVPFLVVFLMTSDVFAQAPHIYLPNLSAEDPNPPIGILTCSDWDHDGVDEDVYALSKEVFPKGTTLPEIRKHYKMLPDDFGKINNKLFPDLVIQSRNGSAVCLPRKYSVEFVDVTGDIDKDFIIRYKNGVPGWDSNLWNGPDIASTASVSETFALVFGAVGLNEAWGSQVVGTLERAGDTWGSIIQKVPGSLSAETIGNVINGFVTADLLYEQAKKEFQFGVDYDAVIFTGKTGFVDYSIPPKEAYFRCYLGNGADAVAVADELRIPDIVRLYLTGEGNQGCVVSSSTKQGGPGDKLYPWPVIQQAAREVLAEKKTRAMTELDAQLIADRVYEWYLEEKDPAPDQFVPPTDTSFECPRLGDNGMREADIIAEGISATIESLKERLENVENTDDLSLYKFQIYFATKAEEVLPDLPMVDRYDTVRPRNGTIYHLGHLTSEPLNQVPNTLQWTVEAVCFSAGGTYEWILNLGQGRLKSGVTSNLAPAQDYVQPRPHAYEDR